MTEKPENSGEYKTLALSAVLAWQGIMINAAAPLTTAQFARRALLISLIQPDVTYGPAEAVEAFNIVARRPLYEFCPDLWSFKTEEEVLERAGSDIILSVKPMKGTDWKLHGPDLSL